jgi:hypothetical protein
MRQAQGVWRYTHERHLSLSSMGESAVLYSTRLHQQVLWQKLQSEVAHNEERGKL